MDWRRQLCRNPKKRSEGSLLLFWCSSCEEWENDFYIFWCLRFCCLYLLLVEGSRCLYIKLHSGLTVVGGIAAGGTRIPTNPWRNIIAFQKNNINCLYLSFGRCITYEERIVRSIHEKSLVRFSNFWFLAIFVYSASDYRRYICYWILYIYFND